MALYPHEDTWRARYYDGIGFNRRLLGIAGTPGTSSPFVREVLESTAHLCLEPSNLVLTSMKRGEDRGKIVVRFYEAEGDDSFAVVKLSQPIRRAWKANLIEEEEEELPLRTDGVLEMSVKAFEIVTLSLSL